MLSSVKVKHNSFVTFLLKVNSVIAVFIAATLYEKVRSTQVLDRRSRDLGERSEADE